MTNDEPTIIDRGRGPEIRGTRITVYDVMDYHKNGDHHTYIAAVLGVSSRQVRAAVEYIEAHREEVVAVYQKILERHARGNSPEIQKKLEGSRNKLMAKMKEIADRNAKGGTDARAAG